MRAESSERGAAGGAAGPAGFRADEAAPLTVGYRGRSVAVPPPPAGGIMVAEAMKVAGRDKDRHVGDPRFVPPPPDHLLSDA